MLISGSSLEKSQVHQGRRPIGAQSVRHAVQWTFLLLNVWIGVRFYLFVRHYETGGQSVRVDHPAGVEGWLPIAGLMNLKGWALTGSAPQVHPAAMVLLLAFITTSFVFRKAFCSWLCPVGTLSEELCSGGRVIFGRNLPVSRWLDVPLRGLKYLLLGWLLSLVLPLSAREINTFLESPYGLIADVKLLNFFRNPGFFTSLTLFLLVLASTLLRNPWCRYLCPYGALLGLVAVVSPSQVRRNAEKCIECTKCAVACPSALPVETKRVIRSAECTACLECVSACRVSGALKLTVGCGARMRTGVSVWALAAGLAFLLFAFVGVAQWSGLWSTKIPDAVYRELIPNAEAYGH